MKISHIQKKMNNMRVQKHIRVKIPGRRMFLIGVDSDETVSDLTARIASIIGVDGRNWGFYMNEPRNFMPNSTKISDIGYNKRFNFLPRTTV